MKKIPVTPASIYADLELIRAKAPLIHNITNFVVMQQTANALLALGASPVMAHALEEINEIVQLANALVINIGTLDKFWLESMWQAVQIAKQRDIPIVIDPVGAGASKLRTSATKKLLEFSPSIIRGNASEIMALFSDKIQTKGVDSLHNSITAVNSAQQLALQYDCVVTISGAVDIVMNPLHQINIHNGVAMMTRVTGMGCTATALIAAFCAVNNNYLHATANAMAVMGIVGELTQELTQGPGSFQYCFNDVLYHLSLNEITEKLQVTHA